MTSLEAKIKQEIKNVKPIQKWELISFSAMKDAGLLLLWVLTIFLIGIIFNIIVNFRQWENLFIAHRFFTPGLAMFPYELFTILILLLIASYYLIKKVHLIYRLPTFMIVSILITSLAIGFILAQTSGLNHFVFSRPGIQKFYRQEGRFIHRGQQVVIGQVTEEQTNKVIIKDQNTNTYTVIINDKTRIIGSRNFEPGDFLRIMGKLQNHEIEALTICILEKDFWGCRVGESSQIKGARQQKPPMY